MKDMDIKKNRSSKVQNRLIILSKFFGSIGSSIFTFGIGLMILKETRSATNFGFSQIVGPLVSLILLPVCGSLIDTFHRKRIVITAQMASILAIFLFLLSNYFAWLPRLISIYILLTILSITDLFLNSTYSASMINMVSKEDIQKIMSAKQMVSTISMITAPILGSLLYTFLSFEAFVIFEISSEILTLILVLNMNFYLFQKEKEPQILQSKSEIEHDDTQMSKRHFDKSEKNLSENKKKSAFSELFRLFQDGLTYVKTTPSLRFMMTLAMFVNMAFTSVLIGFPYICTNVFSFESYQYGTVQASFSVGLLGTGLFLANRRDFKRPLLHAWKLLFLCFLIVFLTGFMIVLKLDNLWNLAIMMLSNFSLGALVGLINIPLEVWKSKSVPSDMQGRVSNLSMTISQLLMPIGILFFGMLYDHPFAPEYILIFSSVMGSLIALSIPFATKTPLKEL